MSEFEINSNVDFTISDDDPAAAMILLGSSDVTRLALSASTIAENGAGGELVGTLSIIGPDFTGPVTYSITSDPSLKFEIAGAGLDELRIKAATTIDFEATSSFAVDLQGVDSTAGTPKTFAKSVTILVTNVNEAPTDITLSANSIPENTLAGSIIGTLSTTDVDAGDTFTYSIDLDADAKFAISGDILIVRTGASFDFETATSHVVTVRSTDAVGLFTPKTFTITITNVNEAPTNIDLSGITVSDAAADGTVIGVLSNPLDPDAGDTATYSIAPGGDPSGNFEVVGGNLQSTVGNTLDNAVNASHSVTLRVTDAIGLPFDKVFTISVTAGATGFQHTDTAALSGLFNALPANHVDTGTDIDVWTDISTKAPANFSQSVTANKLQYVVDGMGTGLPGAQLKVQSVMGRTAQTVRCIAMAARFLTTADFILLNFSTSPASGEFFLRVVATNPLSFDGGNDATARYALNNDALSIFAKGFDNPLTPTALPAVNTNFVIWVEFQADQTFDTAFDRIATLNRSGGMIGEILYFDAVPSEADRIQHRDKLIADWNVTP